MKHETQFHPQRLTDIIPLSGRCLRGEDGREVGECYLEEDFDCDPRNLPSREDCGGCSFYQGAAIPKACFDHECPLSPGDVGTYYSPLARVVFCGIAGHPSEEI